MAGKIIAFVDGSIYAHSVCEHAGWAAARTGALLLAPALGAPGQRVAA